VNAKRLLAISAAVMLTVGATGTTVVAQSSTTRPITRATPPLTPEESAIIDAANRAPADVPSLRIDTARYNKDGTPNENFGKVHQGFITQHELFLKRRQSPIGLLFIGDSITAGWASIGQKVWDERYARLDAANFGINGDRTDGVLWRIEHGELDGIHPKVVVLLIGTNNYGSSASQVSKGIQAVVAAIQAKLPEAKVLLLGVFPRGPVAIDAENKPDPGRQKLLAVNAELAKLDDGRRVRYLEIWRQFLTDDGSLPKETMPDALHPNEKGYRIWADAMQPLLSEMMK
jgi:lysophospholipase L1-like esterase